MSKENRFVIQVDPLEIEDDAIFDNKELRLYECQSDMMSDICSLLNKQDKQIFNLEAKLKESEKKAKAYAKEIIFLDKKLENLNKEFELAQEHNEKTVEYWQNECSQLKQQLSETDKLMQEYLSKCLSLEQQLAEKENLLQTYIQLSEDLSKRLDNRCDICIERHKQSQNQTAIDELEKTKDYAKSIIKRLENEEKFVQVGATIYTCECFIKQIDQQIKSLKGDSQ